MKNVKKTTMRTLVALLAAVSLAATDAGAELQCGDTILPGQKVRLEADVGPCSDATGGITIVGPATLDLNGHAIKCLLHPHLDENPTGITAIGKRAKIKNGSVLLCRNGIELKDEGRHRVTGMTMAVSAYFGMRVHSDRNVVKGNLAIQNKDIGYEVLGERNTLKKNRSEENDFAGFIIEGHSHRVIKNEAIDDHDVGLWIKPRNGEGSPNKIIRNTAESSTAEYDIVAGPTACQEHIFKANQFNYSSHGCVQ